MKHDFLIYNFNQQLTELINNSQLSMGELYFIIESLLNTLNKAYQSNINQYIDTLQQSQNNNEEIVEKIPVQINEIKIPFNNDIDINISSSGQE